MFRADTIAPLLITLSKSALPLPLPVKVTSSYITSHTGSFGVITFLRSWPDIPESEMFPLAPLYKMLVPTELPTPVPLFIALLCTYYHLHTRYL